MMFKIIYSNEKGDYLLSNDALMKVLYNPKVN